MTARGLLRVALPLLALCALVPPAHADPVCLDGSCVSVTVCVDSIPCHAEADTCLVQTCLAVSSPAAPRGCKPITFTGGEPALQLYPLLNMVDIDLSCLTKSPDTPRIH